MTNSQMTNLFNFTILFHRVSDTTYLMNCDMTYIWEKYHKMIGVDPIESKLEKDDFKDELNHLGISIFKDILYLKKCWQNKWKETLIPKHESVLNYLCILNVSKPTPSKIVEVFGKYIGDVEKIQKNEYEHLHPLFLKFMNEYEDAFKREINLEKLV